MYDTAISGRIFHNEGWFDGSIYIDNGRIKRISRSSVARSECGNSYDFTSSYIMPGVIDSHVHMRDPGLTWKEDFSTGTASSAFGGITTVLDMPNTLPATTDVSSLLIKHEIASSKAYVDFGLYLCLLDDSKPWDMFGSKVDAKKKLPMPVAFKAFLGESTGDLTIKDITSLSKFTRYILRNDKKIALHPEDGDLIESNKYQIGSDILEIHNKNRPPLAESSSILKAHMAMGSSFNMAHLLHISSEDGLRSALGKNATIEVTPHHLLLDLNNTEKIEVPAMAKVNPPIRKRSDRASLWNALRNGRIDTIGSDHAPHTLKEKENGLASPSGIPGTETMLPLMLAEVENKRLSINHLIRLLCRNPARIFNLRSKGAIDEGMDADLVVFDMHDKGRIREEDLHSKAGWSVYDGFSAVFPRAVFSKGEQIVDGENLCCKPGRGVNLF
jgi:dihydroorotase